MALTTVAGGRIEYERIPGVRGGPTIVLLHEGLGSISMWRDFPRQVAEATGHEVVLPEFRAWTIEEYLPRITCPVLAIQGEDDEYGTLEQMDRIGRAIPGAQVLKLRGCGHSPHRDRPEEVLAAVRGFVERI